ncbi:phage tail assembly protein [Actinobacillus porcinus]|uniref:phage tail assembly protein n=1 Tax=Actinobacillus porcinus TaxID=51048 RepID=UPI0023EFD396|nr:phage tail assembly protein [Actinobacillus porcinus]MDD7545225.1 phage tail assembly protein [Actinobacillus porcinus]MDY5847117.1 phage tail assembly protein [Actinobacillus porcinus]
MNQATQMLNNFRVFKTYKLQYPVKQPDGNEITEVQLRRMKGADQKALEARNFDFEKDGYKITEFFLVRLTNLVPEDIDELDNVDLAELNKMITELATEGKSKD